LRLLLDITHLADHRVVIRPLPIGKNEQKARFPYCLPILIKMNGMAIDRPNDIVLPPSAATDPARGTWAEKRHKTDDRRGADNHPKPLLVAPHACKHISLEFERRNRRVRSICSGDSSERRILTTASGSDESPLQGQKRDMTLRRAHL